MPPKKKPKVKKPRVSQKQKQSQKVVVNIGTDLIKKKRTYTRRPKARQTTQYPPPPPDSGFVRVIYPVVNNLQQDEIRVQLNSVTKQLSDLQEKALNRTGNLMSGIRAMEREAEIPTALGEPEEQQKPILGQTESSPEPKRGRTKQKKRLEIVEKLPVATQPPLTAIPNVVSQPILGMSAEQRSTSQPRKSRSDKGKSRGPLLRTASQEAIARGYGLVAIPAGSVGVLSPQQGAPAQSNLQPGSKF